MIDSDKNKLLSYFRNPNKKNWSKNQSQEFWSKLREFKHSNVIGCSEYTKYVFPKFEVAILEKTAEGKTVFRHDCNFWKKGEEYKLNSANFSQATFIDRANFTGCHFEGGIQLYNAFFLEDADFDKCIFDEQVVIRHSHFEKRVSFSESKFTKRIVAIEQSYFKGETFFNDMSFDCNARIIYSEFNYLEFSYCLFNGRFGISHCDFKNTTEFIGNHVNDLLILDSCKFSKDNLASFQDFNRLPNTVIPKIEFINMIFNSSFIFRRMNLSETGFYQSDVTDAVFKECFIYGSELIKEDKFVEGGHFDALSDTYRQLKRNFENSKNWELSDIAYRREMVMKKKYFHRLAKKKRYFSLYTLDSLLYFIYEQVSGFNRSYTRPLAILLLSSFVIFPFCYYVIEKSTVYNSLVKSLGATLPYFYKVEDSITYKGWGIHSTQTLISSILLAFFIIAIRRRFKS